MTRHFEVLDPIRRRRMALASLLTIFGCGSPPEKPDVVQTENAHKGLMDGAKPLPIARQSPPPMGQWGGGGSQASDALPAGHPSFLREADDMRTAPLPLPHSDDDLPPLTQEGFFLSTSCYTEAFSGLGGASLTDAIRSQTPDCINQLFKVSPQNGAQLFPEGKMITVAQAFQTLSLQYPGNNQAGLLQLILYLRAGYYVQFYNPAAVGPYAAALQNAVAAGLDAFVDNPRFMATQEEHSAILKEAIILIDSASLNARYILKLLPLLDRYDQNLATSRGMPDATNGIFTVYFRGHQNKDFVDLIQKNSLPLETLIRFTDKTWVSQTRGEYLLRNAGSELGRFLKYDGNIKARTKAVVVDILKRYSMNSPERGLWVALASAAYYYDKADCAAYNVCDLPTQIQDAILTRRHVCSPTLVLRSQALTDDQAASACNTLVTVKSRFFSFLKTDESSPLPGDNNLALEAVFFDNASEYKAYAGPAYGIATNNGGMYLEGDPSKKDNQARFIGYRASWLPTFALWNLEHEFVHYLDGRFNMPGGFTQYMKFATVWWIEGLAEYISKGASNPQAENIAHQQSVPLNDILRNTYNAGTERIYLWGYLGVRYMFEKRSTDVQNIVGLLRTNQYEKYNEQMLAIRNRLDEDFLPWTVGRDSGLNIPQLVFFTPPPPPPTPIPVEGGGANITYYRIQDGIHVSFEAPRAEENYGLIVFNGDTIVHNGALNLTEADIKPLKGNETLRGYIRVYDRNRQFVRKLPEFFIALAGDNQPGPTDPSPTPISGAGIQASYTVIAGGLRLTWETPPANRRYYLRLLQGTKQILNGGHAATQASVTGLAGQVALKGEFLLYDTQGKYVKTLPPFSIRATIPSRER